jgi:ribose transport system permease protein
MLSGSIKSFAKIKELMRKLASLLSLILMSIALTILSPYFLTIDNIFNIGLQMAVIAIMAIGEMMVIISAGIDLSVGSVLALSGVISTIALVNKSGIFLAVVIGVLTGTACGFVNGALISFGKIPPFIATLGMMGIARGLALIITGGVPIFGLPSSFSYLGGGRIINIIPFPVIIVVILALFGHFILKYTKFGRYTYAVGSNVEATRLSGVNIERYLTMIYTFGGLLSGFAGVTLSSRLSTGQPTAGTGWELDVIAACVIGGASFSGGEGSIGGAILGAMIMGVLRNGCNLLNISNFWQQIFIGIIIIIAVFIDQYRKHKMGEV